MIALAVLFAPAFSSNGRWTLANRAHVSAVFYRSSSKVCWRPDGSAVNVASLPKASGLSYDIAPTEDPSLVVFFARGFARGTVPSFRIKLPNTPQLDTAIVGLCDNRVIWFGDSAGIPNAPAQEDVAVGVADGPWKVEGWVAYHKQGSTIEATKSRGVGFHPRLVTDPFPGAKSATSLPGKPVSAFNVVTLPAFRNLAFRVVATDGVGHELAGRGSFKPTGKVDSTTYFFDGNVKNVAMIRIETRPFEWTTIRAAHFRPSETQ